MSFRVKKRVSLTPQLAEECLSDAVKFSGNLDAMRMNHHSTRREMIWLVLHALSFLVLLMWRRSEARKQPPQSERRSTAAGNGGFAA